MKIVCTEKYFTILFVCILFFVEGCLGDKSSQNGSPTFPPQNKTINWYTSLEDARKKSVTSKKLLMIYFFTTWSDWAKKMDKETYSYYKVVEMSGNFICVRIDLDKNPELEKTYNIRKPYSSFRRSF